MVTKIWEFWHKITYNSDHTWAMVNIVNQKWVLGSCYLTHSSKFTKTGPWCHSNKNFGILTQSVLYDCSLYKSYGQEPCIRQVVFKVAPFDGLIFTARQHMQSAVLVIVNPSVRLSVCPSVCPSFTRWHWVKTTQATIMRTSLEDSPMTLVSSTLDFTAKFQREHGERGRRIREG